MKPFWARLAEGLADLVVDVIKYKAKQRWPGLYGGAPEIADRKETGDKAGLPASRPEDKSQAAHHAEDACGGPAGQCDHSDEPPGSP